MREDDGSDPTTRLPALTRPDDAAGASIPLTFGPTVTLFFSDIRGFTEYTDERGDAAAFRMLQFHNTMVQEQIALYGGHIVKRLGDSFMVSFDAARNAMACGIGVQKSLAQYNEQESGARINIGIGINTGEPIRDSEDFFGGSVNLAARICAAAVAGEILVSEGVRHVVGKMEGTDYIDRGFFELKGFHEPQHLYAVDWSGVGGAAAASGEPQVVRASTPQTPGAVPRAPSPPSRPARSRLLLIVGGVVLLLVGGLIGALMIRPQRVVGPAAGQPIAKPVAAAVASPAAKPASAVPPASSISQPSQPAGVIRSDDFSDPAHGLFPNNQRGTGRATAENGTQIEYQWSFVYQGGALVGRLAGDVPSGVRVLFGRTLMGVDKLFDDFAVELRGKVLSSPDGTRFGFQYLPTSSESVSFTLAPGTSNYIVTHGMNQQFQTLNTGKSTALVAPGEENLLRVEIRGDTGRLFVNGQEVARVQHEALARRGGTIGLIVVAATPLENRTAEVQFSDFKELALAP